MHRHTVLFNVKADADEEATIETLKVLGTLPTVEHMVIEENIVPVGEKSPFKWLMIGDFKDEDARQTYEKDPKHVDIVRNTFLPNVDGYIVSDINF